MPVAAVHDFTNLLHWSYLGLQRVKHLKLSIGVIVSTYNSPGYLSSVLNGYLRQSRYPDELIVADDGSTPETGQVVSDFARTAPFPVRHVWHEDAGFRLAKIRNEAVKTASADYLVFTDGDCVPHLRFVEDHAAMSRQGYFVTGKRMLVSEGASGDFHCAGILPMLKMCLKGELSGGHHLLRLPWVFFSYDRRLRGVKGCNIGLFRSDCCKINGFNEGFIGWGREDSEFVTRLYNAGLRRREYPFAGIVFHLWHRENMRSSLAANDQLLEEAISSGSACCENGIVKRG